MAKNVIVLASGETERRALPHLLFHLRDCGVSLMEVRIPPRNGELRVQMAERIIKAAWYERLDAPPDKFVILLDVDGKPSNRVLEPFRALPERLGGEVEATVLYAYAQWHLEAWYFADAVGLRGYLHGRTLGTSTPPSPTGFRIPSFI